MIGQVRSFCGAFKIMQQSTKCAEPHLFTSDDSANNLRKRFLLKKLLLTKETRLGVLNLLLSYHKPQSHVCCNGKKKLFKENVTESNPHH